MNPQTELNELFLFTLSMIKREANILPDDKHDMLRRGKMEAYSHCYLELKSIYDKWQSLVNTPEPDEPELPTVKGCTHENTTNTAC